MKYHLITSNAKISNKNRIFLGDWCGEVKNKNKNNKSNIVKINLGRDENERKKIEKKILIYEKKIFPQLYKLLNNLHNTHNSKQYYSFIIGKWLRRYLAVMLNRYLTLSEYLRCNKNKIQDIWFETYNVLSPPLDSFSAIEFFDDPKINDWIYIQTLKSVNSNFKIKIKHIRQIKSKRKYNIGKKNVFKIILNKVNTIIQKYFSYSDKTFFIGTFMPLYKEAILNLYFFQLPKIWKKNKINYSEKADLDLRIKLKNLLVSNFLKQKDKNKNGEFKFLIENLFHMMPTSYIENFLNIKDSISKSYWPEKPNLIFTSNNFDTDEGFKIYLAEQKENNPNLKYIIGQHGMGYNIRNTKTHYQEREIADKVFVWGKYTENKNQIPGFILKSSKIDYDKNGNILIVCTHLGYRIEYWDKNYFFSKNFNRKISFLAAFKKKFLHQNITVRLGTYFERYNFNEKIKIKKKFPKIYIDENKNINKSYAVSRLVVHFYFATTFLETVSKNIPSVMLLDIEEFSYNKKAISIFKILEKNNILFYDAKKLQIFIEKNYNNLEKWWHSKKTQKALNLFRSNYCRNGSLRKFRDMIKKTNYIS